MTDTHVAHTTSPLAPIPSAGFLNTDDPDRARTVLVAIQKGGTGKTTVTMAVAAEAARLGARVLLIDLDPNWGLTQNHLGFDPHEVVRVGELIRESPPVTGSAARAVLKAPDPWQPRHDVPWERGGAMPGTEGAIGFIPGYPDTTASMEIAASHPAHEKKLLRSLEGVSRQFDLVLIDTGPRADRLASMGIEAAGTVLCVSDPEDGGVAGVHEQLEYLANYHAQTRTPFRFAGVVINKFDPRNTTLHPRGVARTGSVLADWVAANTDLPLSERIDIPALPGFMPGFEAGPVMLPDRMKQSTLLPHAHGQRKPISTRLDASQTPKTREFFSEMQRQRNLGVVLPFTRLALRLLRITDAPGLPAIRDAIIAADPVGVITTQNPEGTGLWGQLEGDAP